jgi:5-(carboxyamino)imidazole ribonucleotide mutase
MSDTAPLVSIVMGSDSDLPVMREAERVLGELGVPCEITVASAHRTPDRVAALAQGAGARGVKVIIAAAGGAAHLAGFVAAYTTLPVVAVPITSKALSGVDSLYSMAQMPPGIPVGTMAIDGARNAGIYAAEIIGAFDAGVAARLQDFRERMRAEVNARAARLEAEGSEAYLKAKQP